MGEMITLTASDGHTLDAYLAEAGTSPKGGIVLIHEIFGLTGQMKRAADQYAEAGYTAIVPAMFDRIEKNLVLGYTEFQKGGKTAMSIDTQNVLADVAAARDVVAAAGSTAIMGFCWGGTVTFMAACGLKFACGVSWYGGGIGALAGRMKPKIPVQYHFGGDDAFIPPETIDQIRAVDERGEFHVYPGAGHGFCCDDRDSYHADAARLSVERSLKFMGECL